MEPEEPENRQENPAGTGTIEHQNIQEKEPAVQNPRTIPDGMPGADQLESLKASTPQETGKKAGTDKKPVIPHPVNEVKRKTELQGMSTKSSPDGPTQVRRRTERDLKDPEFGIPYAATEKAVRDLVCSLMERQNRMNADIFLEINSMQEDIGMLKDQVYKIRITKSGTAAGDKK
jgi:hypothetical protein